MKYISIDGDDIGRKITSCYLSNRCSELSKLSRSLDSSTRAISNLLTDCGFDVIFCAADGVVASTNSEFDYHQIFIKVNALAPENITFSAGVGDSLREAYIALISAKSNGKNRLHHYHELNSCNSGNQHV